MATTTAQVASVPYSPPLAAGSPTAVSSGSSSTQQASYATSTAQPGHTDTYLYYFIVPYLDAHVLSPPSWRYAYIFWIFVAALLVLWTAFFQIQRSAKLRALHSLCRLPHALSIRRLIPTRNDKRKWYSTNLSVGNLIALLSFLVVLLCVSLIGDDYIKPTTCTWGGECPVQVFNQGPPKSSYSSSKRFKRDRVTVPALPQTSRLSGQPNFRRYPSVILPRASAMNLNPNGWAPFNDPLLAAPNYDIPRNMWTLSSRFGLIAYAMIPLVVSIGLKSWPFNIFASPWTTYYGFDKMGVLHRWTGRFVWIWSTIHTITFAIQLSRDHNPYGNMILGDVWKYYRFNWGVVAYVALTITTCFSFNPLRSRYYEVFYVSHVILIIVFLVGCIIHYEPLWAWAVIGLALWGAERGIRLLDWFWFNGFFISPPRFWATNLGFKFNEETTQRLQKHHSHTQTLVSQSLDLGTCDGLSQCLTSPHDYPPGSATHSPSYSPMNGGSGYFGTRPMTHPDVFPPRTRVSSIEIPKGFALVQVLPGQTVRLTLKMIKEANWSLGQYVMLTIPSVNWWQSHPYTITCSSLVSSAEDSSQGKELVLMLRARQGFSKRLYHHVLAQRARERNALGTPTHLNGTLMRCQISRPLGSSARVRWKGFESVLIVCGGSGVSFGLAILEELCYDIWLRAHSPAVNPDGSKNGIKQTESKVARIRFVWIFREYAHLSWAASAIKRCMDSITQQELGVDLYVSNSLQRRSNHMIEARKYESCKPPPGQHPSQLNFFDEERDDNRSLLEPPRLPFAKFSDSALTLAGESTSSVDVSELADASDKAPPADGDFQPNIHEFTDFDGESMGRSECEAIVSAELKTESKKRKRDTIKRLKGAFEDSYGKRRPPMAGLSTEKPTGDGSKEVDTAGELGGKTELLMDLNPVEKLRLRELSEIVNTGRPRLQQILHEEIQACAGHVLVGCCGPQSLNSYMRSLVSDEEIKMIKNVKRFRSGIEVYSEDFAF